MICVRAASLKFIAATCGCLLLGACGGGDDSNEPVDVPVTIVVTGPTAVSYWNEVATNTINVPASATGTPEEQRPNTAVDLATVHVAIYDAVIAIAGTHRPYAVTPTSATSGAMQEAAVAAAAYRVLLGLFPNRSAQYQSAYDTFVANLPAGAARTQGLAVGAEVAAGILALRANDGRSVALAAYVPGTEPGQFRGVNPIGRPNPYIKPFALTTLSQFRAPGPPALTSAAYAADVNETKALGSATSTVRTAEQTEIARFNTESPATFQPRNMRSFAMTSRSTAEHARLMAMVFVTQADAGNACFESKYHYQFWRPSSAITLANTDGNDATVADAGWTPVVATPNHPEYPAAHGCITSAMAEVLRAYYGTPNVTFEYTSTVTGTTRKFTNTASLVDETEIARIAGGMHFRTSTVHGAALGKSVANWVTARNFQPR
jgi:PAP2 superfamily